MPKQNNAGTYCASAAVAAPEEEVAAVVAPAVEDVGADAQAEVVNNGDDDASRELLKAESAANSAMCVNDDDDAFRELLKAESAANSAMCVVSSIISLPVAIPSFAGTSSLDFLKVETNLWIPMLPNPKRKPHTPYLRIPSSELYPQLLFSSSYIHVSNSSLE